MEYRVVTGPTDDDLSTKVNELLQQGWEPHGGLVIAVSGMAIVFGQALVKKT